MKPKVPKLTEVTDEMVIEWLWEAEIEERRTHVLFEDVGDPESVLDHEKARHFAKIHVRAPECTQEHTKLDKMHSRAH